MPNRVLRSGILESRAVNALSEQAEIFYRRLMSVVDDWGRSEADMDVLRVKLFPLQLERWPTDRVIKALDECCKGPLVIKYQVGVKTYIQINNFGQRQQSKPKCPPPPQETLTPKIATVDAPYTHQIDESKLTEICDAYERHHKHNNYESKDHVIRMVLSKNGDFKWDLFRQRHLMYCQFWDEKGWSYSKLSFLGWIEAGMPLPPVKTQTASALSEYKE